MRHLACLVSFLIVTGCASVGQPVGDLRPAHLERLYFGRDIGDTATVSDSAWGVFVRDVLTPTFPEGATIWDATGYWRAPDGAMVQENSFVVELLHVSTPDGEARVQHVMDAYKVRFAQQSVLRIVTAVRVVYF